MRVSVIGAGAWGTTLSIIFSEAGHDVKLWVYESRLCGMMIEGRENKWYLPGFQVPVRVEVTHRLDEALDGAELAVFVVPSRHIRSVAEEASKQISRTAVILSATKGLEEKTGKRMSEVLGDSFSNKIAVLSGPNLSKEIARGMPSATVVASEHLASAQKVQSAMMLERFRVYTSNDVIGVELGGALKNSIAIAAGIVDGLNLGDNAKSALIVRGMVEISRLGCLLGASPETFAGLSGMGDLITTCASSLSRNHQVGAGLAKGRCLEDILESTREVAEGVHTTRVAVDISKKNKVELPIISEVYRVLFEGKEPFKAISDLMTRKGKKE